MHSRHYRILSVAAIAISKFGYARDHNITGYYTILVGTLVACKYLKITFVSGYKYKFRGRKRTETTRLRNYRVHSGRIRMITRADQCEAELSAVDWDEMKILGLDCEWSRKPIALLQLALPDGTCFLVHLCRMKSMPPMLESVLANKRCVYCI